MESTYFRLAYFLPAVAACSWPVGKLTGIFPASIPELVPRGLGGIAKNLCCFVLDGKTPGMGNQKWARLKVFSGLLEKLNWCYICAIRLNWRGFPDFGPGNGPPGRDIPRVAHFVDIDLLLRSNPLPLSLAAQQKKIHPSKGREYWGLGDGRPPLYHARKIMLGPGP